MTGRIPSAETKAWICTGADWATVQPQLQQYFCCTFVALLSYLSPKSKFKGLKFGFVNPATLYLHIFSLIGEIKLKNWR